MNKRYKSVWITIEDFGSLPNSDGFVLNIQTAIQIESTRSEIVKIGTELFKNLTEEECTLFWRTKILNADERIRHHADDMIIL